MVGQGVLRECLLDPGVTEVLAVGRNPTGQSNAKLRDLVHRDLFDLSPIENELRNFDACFWCLGVTSAGMKEPEYRRVTVDLALAAATTLARTSPALTFVFISGAGADSTERGRVMWTRVKGAAENAILKLPFKAAYVVRPAGIVPLHGITSRTRAYRISYALLRPLLSPLRRMFPKYVTTTELLGRTLIRLARSGAPKRILESADLG